MFKVLLLVSLVVIASGQYAGGQYAGGQYAGGQYGGLEYNHIPNPYQFSYSSPSEGGQSSHQESGDGSGRVTGSYTVVNEDGSSRTVEYVADENGFRPSITTNEPGTSNQAPADVVINSSADDGHQGGGIQYGGAPRGLQYAPGNSDLGYTGGILPYGADYGAPYY